MTTLDEAHDERDAAPRLPVAPFPGLRPFRGVEWPLFFGREVMVDEVITRLVERHVVFVHGESGSGKSSLIHAGVLPALKVRAEHTRFRWRTCFAQPGRRPVDNIVNAFAELLPREGEDSRFALRQAMSFGRDAPAAVAELIGATPARPVCLLLDQFEEIFTLAPDDTAREARNIVDFLVALHDPPEPGLYVAVTMRSDFLGLCAKYRDFAETVNATQYLLPRMKRQELLRAIEEPALLCGGEVERALANRLIDETAETIDQLPLIQHGLMMMRGEKGEDAGWVLTLEDYRTRDESLADMLSRHADEIAEAARKNALPARPGRRVVEHVFKALTDTGTDGQPVRRPQTLAQLADIAGESFASVQAVLRPFRDEQVAFLRPFGAQDLAREDQVDLGHEALIRYWKHAATPVSGWLAEEFRDGMAWRILVAQLRDFESDPKNVISHAAALNGQALIKSHTPAWSGRYGGQWDAVNKLVAESIRAGRRRASQGIRTVVLVAVTVVALLVALGVWLTLRNEREVATLQANADLEKRVEQVTLQEKRRTEFEKQRTLATIDALAQSLPPQADSRAADIVQQLRDAAAPNPEQAHPDVRNVAARVYVFVSDRSQLAAAQVIADRISTLEFQHRTVIVPRVVSVLPARHSVFRCFTAEDCAEAPELYDQIRALVRLPILDAKPQLLSGVDANSPPRHYELLFAPGPIELPSSAGASEQRVEDAAVPIAYSQEIVDRIRNNPAAPLAPRDVGPPRTIAAIILHDSRASDDAIPLLRSGRADLQGPLAHWAVQSDGRIVEIANEGVRANHVGVAIDGVNNANTIGITLTGDRPLRNPAQLESLVRLVADRADALNIPTSLILSHGEAALPAGRNNELLQQAPIIRQMVDAVRKGRTKPGG